MCGLAGSVNRVAPCDREVLTAMTRALRHRGPDDEGFYVNDTVGLGHRRLSIIDLSPGGHQPLSNEDGSIWITFNGEIYNFQALREELLARGHSFRGNSDTEVIVHLYEELGPNCVERLRGMFAFAIWDDRQRRLLLARDRVGKKPLLYATLSDGGLAFASEFQGMLAHPGVDRTVNRSTFGSYLTYGYIPSPETAFAGIRKLPPAHWLLWKEGRATIERYWQLDYTPKTTLSEPEACEALLTELREAVRLRMIADVPLGAFLSGGIDSSAVVALMSQLSDRPVKTFSIGFEEAAFNELDYARKVAIRFDTEHHELIVRPKALDILPTLARHYGEPYADSSAVPSYYVAQATRAHVTVALNGDGGDESFAGYERYLGTCLAETYHRLPASLRQGVVEPLSRLLPECGPTRGRVRQARRFLQVASTSLEERYQRWVTWINPALQAELLTEEARAELPGSDAYLDRLLRAHADLPPLDRVLCVDVNSYLPSDLLVKMDIATMANSLEARSPFLDHHVMEFAARLPVRLKLRGGQLKYLLKRAFRGLLPDANLFRRKQGFGVPVGEWFRAELKDFVRDLLLSSRARQRGLFRPQAVQRLLDRHQRREQDHTYPLWALLMLELWHVEMVD